MSAPFRRAERHRPSHADKFARRQAARHALEAARRQGDLEFLKLRSIR